VDEIRYELVQNQHNALNQLTARTVRGLGGLLLSDSTYTYDKRGNLIGETDAFNGTTQSYEYDATNKGERLNILDNFTNHEYDETLGIYYAKARFYDPVTMRFMALDPIRDGTNWYMYAGNNPTRYTDPLGLATYKVGGMAHAPQYLHDKGFVYDPNAIASEEDEANWDHWGWISLLSSVVPWLRDASKMYAHYRQNTGTQIRIDYARAYKEDKTIKATIDAEIALMKEFVNLVYERDGLTSFEIIGDLQAVLNGSSENWQKTIGAHYTYGHGIVTITTATGMASMITTFQTEDVYNFNPGQQDIASGTPDAVNGRFAVLGWAKEFKVLGSFTQTITWQVFSPTPTPPFDQLDCPEAELAEKKQER
jgi:RHS repeat-associated protein